MARRVTGQFYEWERKDGTTGYGVRFTHQGKRRFVTLGGSEDGMTRKKAEAAKDDLMALVRTGHWTPEEEQVREPEPREVPTFHQLASTWFDQLLREGGSAGRGLSEKTARDVRDWRLRDHILPLLKDYRVDEITVEVVDRYRAAKVREGRLSPSSINKMLTSVASVLELGVEYGYLSQNPAAGKRRRLKTAKPRRTYLDQAAQIEALLVAAGELDEEGRSGAFRRTLLATFVFSGVRIGEGLDLRWADVNLAAGRLRVRGTKTDAAHRNVELLPALRDELAALKARRFPEPEERVFASSRGGRLSESNIRSRTLAPAVERANAALREAGEELIPDGLTPHSLRRTFASLLVALGRDPAVAMSMLGHTTPHFTLSTYAKSMEWGEGERERLRALVEGGLDCLDTAREGKAANADAEPVSEVPEVG